MEIEHLSANLGKKTILEDISFSLRKGKITVLLGKNGCGKTTLLRTLTGLVKPKGGLIRIDGKDFLSLPEKEKAKTIAYLPQSLPTPAISVKDLLTLARYPFSDFGQHLKEEDESLIVTALERTGFQDKANRLLCHLSGGERTMAYLSMMLAKNSPYLFLDEPYASLDIPSQKKLTTLLKEEKEKGKSILLSMHDLLLATQIGDEIILLDEGKLLFEGKTEDFLSSHVYQEIYQVEVIQAKDEEGNLYPVLKKK